MFKRLLTMIAVGAVITTATVLLGLGPVTVAGQAPTPAAKAGSVPKTAWGEPDLQGIWTDEYQTPLQRPARYANKEFFTEDERAALDAQRAALLRREVRGER